jgi:hypothetical protein
MRNILKHSLSIPIAGMSLFLPSPVLAKIDITKKVVRAFDPIIALTQAVAYPLCYCAMAVGICLMIVGQKHTGVKTIKWAAVGFLMMQWLPGVMNILMEVGKAMR